MCLSSSPTAPVENKPVEYLHNSFLDGATIQGAGNTTNRNSLRNDLTAPKASGAATTPPVSASPGFGLGAPLISTSSTAPPPSPGIVIPTIGGALAGTIGGVAVP
jgi:hypothetical protein